MGVGRLTATTVALVLGLGASQGRADPATDSGQGDFRLELDAPAPGIDIGGPLGLGFVSGRALAFGPDQQGLDVVLAIDTSDSTDSLVGEAWQQTRAGVGRWSRLLQHVGLRRSESLEGSVLAGEVRLAHTLLDGLDPQTTRVGLVTFAGDWDPATSDSVTRVPLTSDFARLRRGLGSILRRGTEGLTTLTAGLDRAVVELLGTRSALGAGREQVRRVVVLLTDGRDGGLPGGETRRATRAAADRAARLGIRVYVGVVGEEAERAPDLVHPIALATGGATLAAAQPQSLTGGALFDFTEIDRILVRNRTLETDAAVVQRRADGRFGSLVRLREGVNRIEVTAAATNGSAVAQSIDLTYVPGDPAPESSAELAHMKTQVLQEFLLEGERRRPERARDRPAAELEVGLEEPESPTGTLSSGNSPD